MSLPTLGTEFPFNFLHAEIIKYFTQKHDENKAKRSEFLEQTRSNEETRVIQKDRELFNHFALRVSFRFDGFQLRVHYQTYWLLFHLPSSAFFREMLKLVLKVWVFELVMHSSKRLHVNSLV